MAGGVIDAGAICATDGVPCDVRPNYAAFMLDPFSEACDSFLILGDIACAHSTQLLKSGQRVEPVLVVVRLIDVQTAAEYDLPSGVGDD